MRASPGQSQTSHAMTICGVSIRFGCWIARSGPIRANTTFKLDVATEGSLADLYRTSPAPTRSRTRPTLKTRGAPCLLFARAVS